MVVCDSTWPPGQSRYLGLQFLINGKVHFGWARLNVTCRGLDVVAKLTGYAYETVPNKPIGAGQTKGSDEETGAGRDAALTAPTPKTSWLGLLALGSYGLPIWRREELVGAVG